MRIVFIQAGDYSEAFKMLRQGFAESSHSQRYSVDYVASLKNANEFVCVVCTTKTYDYHELANGVSATGVKYFSGQGGRYRQPENLIPAIEQLKPTHVVVRQPIPEIFTWCAEQGVACLPLLADSYGSRFREIRFKRLLSRSLRRSNLQWVSNHQVDACRTLISLGLSESMLIPWDWPQRDYDQVTLGPKDGLAEDGVVAICYAGRIETHKGVGDLIRALKILKNDDGRRVRLSLYGDGEEAKKFENQVRSFDLTDAVSFKGKVPVSDVVSRMNNHDIVVVASRHYSNEGMPNTIRQAIRSRSPLVVSDHPAFSSVVEHEVNSLVYKASKPASLAQAIRRLSTDQDLYRRLSRIDVADITSKVPDWHVVIERWLEEDVDWLEQHSLAALYPKR